MADDKMASRALNRDELAQAIMLLVIEKGLASWRDEKFIASNAYALADAMQEARK
jgi:hypothetical protein